jgi:hypothetical protein
VVVLRPSLEPDQRLTTPFENPGLARIGERDDFVAHAAFIQAVTEELQSVPERATSGYPAFESIADTLALLTGQRPPQTIVEESQREALEVGKDTFYVMFVATTQDDTSEGQVSNYDVSPLVTLGEDSIASAAMRLLVAPDGTKAMNAGELASNVKRWAEMLRLYDFAGDSYRPLMAEVMDSTERLFEPWLYATVVPHCWTAAPVRHDDGSVECRIYVETLDRSPCASRLGMLDPW